MIDQEVRDIIAAEEDRQKHTIELIASENFVSDEVRMAAGSVLCNKYTEGYPGNRYYGGCEQYDKLETLCQERWLKVFHAAKTYGVNVQPHSGSQANQAAYAALAQPGDTILAMSLQNGGHLTHGSPVNFSGKIYNFVFYGVDKDGFIDYDDIRQKIIQYKPRIVLAGASAYSREIDFMKINFLIGDASYQLEREDPDAYGKIYYDRGIVKPYFMVDMAHIAGLIATGYHQTPFGWADVITTTTHKTLRGARGGLIFYKKNLERYVNSAVFPGTQGGSLMNMVAAKAVSAYECLQPEYHEYIGKVVENTKAMCDEFIKLGYDIVTGGTDNHLFLIDLTKLGLTGLQVQEECDKYGITLNKNCVPNETRSPKYTSGIRIGCAAETTAGKTAEDFRQIAKSIDWIIKSLL